MVGWRMQEKKERGKKSIHGLEKRQSKVEKDKYLVAKKVWRNLPKEQEKDLNDEGIKQIKNVRLGYRNS